MKSLKVKRCSSSSNESTKSYTIRMLATRYWGTNHQFFTRVQRGRDLCRIYPSVLNPIRNIWQHLLYYILMCRNTTFFSNTLLHPFPMAPPPYTKCYSLLLLHAGWTDSPSGKRSSPAQSSNNFSRLLRQPPYRLHIFGSTHPLFHWKFLFPVLR